MPRVSLASVDNAPCEPLPEGALGSVDCVRSSTGISTPSSSVAVSYGPVDDTLRRRIHCSPIELGQVEPDADPTFVAEILGNVEVIRRELTEDVVHVCGCFAVQIDTAVAVMIDQEPSETLLADFEAEMSAHGFGFGFWK